jgi:hypothetical protein
MKRFYGLLLAAMALISCSRDRVNAYDVLNDGFTPPAPLQWCDGSPVYDPGSGYLVGVVVTLAFCEPFPKNLGITHILYAEGSAVDSAGFVINGGTQVWQVGIYTGSQFPVGIYCLKLFFGGFPIAGFPFQVVEVDGRKVFKGITAPVPVIPDPEDRVLYVQF